MITLGIESSCDETAVAIIKDGSTVLSSLISSQIAIHRKFGGVVPEVAARNHLTSIYPLYIEAIEKSGIEASAIDNIAITQGPGLIGALLVGVSFAKGLALALNKPLIPVNHVNAHLHGALLGLGDVKEEEIFPALSLVVSGGHTNLYYMESPLDFGLIAVTMDDACGECFDKVAKTLGFEYPGGPLIEKRARNGDAKKIKMPRMVKEKKLLAFSYSGLKTHMFYHLKKRELPLAEQDMNDLCAAFQDEALGQLVRKTKLAHDKFPKAKSLIVAGGVAANIRLRTLLGEGLSIPSHFPSLEHCSDNAAMIAALGQKTYLSTPDAETVFAPTVKWDAFSRYPFEKFLVGFNP